MTTSGGAKKSAWFGLSLALTALLCLVRVRR